MMNGPETGDKPSETPRVIPSRQNRRNSHARASSDTLPAEWQAILEASQEVEKDYLAEREKNQKLARELTRVQFEKEILFQQVEEKGRQIRDQASRSNQKINELADAAENRVELSGEISVLRSQLEAVNEKLAVELKSAAAAIVRAAQSEKKAAESIRAAEAKAAERAARAEEKAAETVAKAETKAAATAAKAEALAAAAAARAEERVLQATRELEKQVAKIPERLEVVDPELHEKIDQLIASLETQSERSFDNAVENTVAKAPLSPREDEEPAAVPADVKQERVRFRQIASSLHREVEYLKQIYPIRGLLAAKELEVERVKKALKRLPASHPDRALIAQIVSDHVEERRRIEGMLRDMEQRLEEQCQTIQKSISQAAPEAPVFETQPDDSIAKSATIRREIETEEAAADRHADAFEAALEAHVSNRVETPSAKKNERAETKSTRKSPIKSSRLANSISS